MMKPTPAITPASTPASPITSDDLLGGAAGGDEHCTTGTAVHQVGCEIGYHGTQLVEAAIDFWNSL